MQLYSSSVDAQTLACLRLYSIITSGSDAARYAARYANEADMDAQTLACLRLYSTITSGDAAQHVCVAVIAALQMHGQRDAAFCVLACETLASLAKNGEAMEERIGAAGACTTLLATFSAHASACALEPSIACLELLNALSFKCTANAQRLFAADGFAIVSSVFSGSQSAFTEDWKLQYEQKKLLNRLRDFGTLQPAIPDS